MKTISTIVIEVRQSCHLVVYILYFLQATAVWLSKEAPKAKQYKSAELVSELSLKLYDFILHQSGDPRYQADPLLGLKDALQLGEVVEYFSPEMGLVRLDTGRAVLFHLNQVIYFYLYFASSNSTLC